MTSLASPWAALWPLVPALVVTGYFVLAFGIFAARTALVGLPVDIEVQKRSASPLLGRYLRHYLMWVLGPWERLLVRSGISPNTITLASLASACISGAAIASGRFALGGWLYLLTGILDILDGRIARKTDKVSRSGAYVDSVIDRYAELVVFSGFAFFYRSSWALGVVLLAAIGSVMVSYARARGESLGVDVNIGTMQRPERLFYLGFTTAMAPIIEALFGHGRLPPFVPAVAALALLAASANVTAIRRILHTIALLDEIAAAEPAEQGEPKQVPPSLPLRVLKGGR